MQKQAIRPRAYSVRQNHLPALVIKMMAEKNPA